MASSSSSYNSMSVDFSFPDYFLQPARCLIALTGLDTRNNAVHMAIWDLFKVPRRGERKPVNYTRVNADHLYPKRKEVYMMYWNSIIIIMIMYNSAKLTYL